MDVEVRHIDQSRGNGLFAKRNFAADSIIFEEIPLVAAQFSWNAAYKYQACDHCLRPLESAEENVRRLTGKPDIILPYTEACTTNKAAITGCNDCGVQYCSLDCQAKAYDQYHRTLCLQRESLQNLNETWKQIHYPPETSTIMLIPRIIATIQQSPDKHATLSKFLRFCHRSVNDDAQLAHKFLGEKFATQIKLLHQILLDSISHTDVDQLLSFEGFQSLLALIGTNGQGIATSPFSQWVERSTEISGNNENLNELIDKLYEDMSNSVGTFLDNEGVGLFEVQSACNHSCEPNAQIVYENNCSMLTLKALKDISDGTEICISYLDECSLARSRHSRQKELKENYLFVCSCEKCLSEADQADLTSDEEMSDSD